MKEKFTGALGAFGIVLYYLFRLLCCILPFVMINAPFLLLVVFFFIAYFVPASSIIFWIWGLVCAIRGPQDFLAIIYYIATVIAYLPFILSIFSTLFSKE